MPVELLTIRCLADNYAYLIHGGGETALIDAPEAAPILSALRDKGWSLDHVLITHHHPDHVQALGDIKAEHEGVKVWAAEADRHRLPNFDRGLEPEEHFTVCGQDIRVIDVSGHTVGHVAFYLKDAKIAFTADSLMAMGCGRLFEGNPEMMWDSLSRLNELPEDTLICSGHDYCASNGAFALSVDPDNQALKDRLGSVEEGKEPCAPSTLAVERETNPFLRVDALKGAMDMGDEPDHKVFAELRRQKDNF